MILGLAAKKQGGKGSIANFILRNQIELGLNNVKIFPMAEPLKRLCVDILGLSEEQCFGTEEQKNSLTRYKWENLPHREEMVRIGTENWEKYIQECVSLQDIKKSFPDDFIKSGFMTAREVLQQIGTEVFRRMYCDVWAEANIRKITKEGFAESGKLAIIDDIRFPNEVNHTQNAGGIVVKLTRDIYGGRDQHPSERELDADKFNWKLFNYIVDNQHLSLTQQNKAIFNILCEAKFLDEVNMPIPLTLGF